MAVDKKAASAKWTNFVASRYTCTRDRVHACRMARALLSVCVHVCVSVLFSSPVGMVRGASQGCIGAEDEQQPREEGEWVLRRTWKGCAPTPFSSIPLAAVGTARVARGVRVTTLTQCQRECVPVRARWGRDRIFYLTRPRRRQMQPRDRTRLGWNWAARTKEPSPVRSLWRT